MNNRYSKLDLWVKELLVDPIGKEKLTIRNEGAFTNYGKFYPVVNGVFDFRPFSAEFMPRDLRDWKAEQAEYEKWSEKLGNSITNDYIKEREGVREVYEKMPITGRCLDVGGHQGRLRTFLKKNQEYVIIDPFLSVFNKLDTQKELLETYPFITEPVNFLCGMAEYLPFVTGCFDTVHMRSVIDHFHNPELAMWEAYRVLRKGGQVIVGLYVEGGSNGQLNMRERLKNIAAKILPNIGLDHFVDHHVWHPKYSELCQLIESVGFKIDCVLWQSQWKDRVVYLKAVKSF